MGGIKYRTFVADIDFKRGITLLDFEDERIEIYCVNKKREMSQYKVEEKIYDNFLIELFNYLNENDDLSQEIDSKITNKHFMFKPDIDANQSPCAFK